MHLTYQPAGAVAIQLQIVHFFRFEQRALYSPDNVDRAGTTFRIGCRCIFNQQATASQGGAVAVPPPGVQGDGPALSVATLRDTLLMPRGQLTVDVGGQVIVSAPRVFGGAAASVDMTSGPRPIRCDVMSLHGVATMIVDYEIEATVNECRPDVPSQLISNRWTMHESLTEDYRANLEISGTAIFRQDLMEVNGVRPDSLRGLIIPGVQAGYQRRILDVTLSSDNTRIDWAVMDEQVIYSLLPNSGIVKIRGYAQANIDWSGGAFGVAGARLPEMFVTVHVECWGRASAGRSAIANALVQALAAGGVPTNKRICLRASVRVDLPERRGTADVVVVRGGLIGGLQNLFGGAPNLDDLKGAFKDYDCPGVWFGPGVARATIAPGTDGRHSDALMQLIAQTLTAPCAAPGGPVTVAPPPVL